MNKRMYKAAAILLLFATMIIGALYDTLLSHASESNISGIIGDDEFMPGSESGTELEPGRVYFLVDLTTKYHRYYSKCISYDENTKRAVMITYGFLPETWPGKNDLTTQYGKKFNDLSDAISDIRLPYFTSDGKHLGKRITKHQNTSKIVRTCRNKFRGKG